MTDLRQAAQQLLEACEQRLPLNGQAAIIDELNNLRTALEQQQAERWCMKANGCKTECGNCPNFTQPEQQAEPVAKYSDIVSDGGLDPRNKFDTAPPQRKPLTDEEIDYWIGSNSTKKALARAIEAAHNIKEGT